jgi:hypothetical protein
MGIVIDGTDGSPMDTTLGEMADALRNRPSQEDLDKLALHKKVFEDGDPAAVQEFLSKQMPVVSDAPKTPDQERIDALSQQVITLQNQVQTLSPVVNRITDQAGEAQIANAIKSNADKLPCCSKVPRAASLIASKEREILNLVEKQGVLQGQTPLVKQQILTKIRVKAFETVEGQLSEYAKAFGVSPEVAPAQPAPGARVVDDQKTTQPEGGKVHAAPYQWDPRLGGFVDTRVQGVSPEAAPVPAAPVQPTPTGGSPGVVEEKQPGQRMTVGNMRESMKARISEVGNVL